VCPAQFAQSKKPSLTAGLSFHTFDSLPAHLPIQARSIPPPTVQPLRLSRLLPANFATFAGAEGEARRLQLFHGQLAGKESSLTPPRKQYVWLSASKDLVQRRDVSGTLAVSAVFEVIAQAN
jgi:hypothetical protein